VRFNCLSKFFFCLSKIVYRARNQTKIKLANEIKISARRNSVCECLAHLSTHQMSIGNFWFGDEESKAFLNLLYSILFWLLSVYYMQLWFANMEGAHRLLFLSFISLKNEDNHHLGVDKTMNLSCAGNWIKRNLRVSWNIPYKFPIYKTSDAFTRFKRIRIAVTENGCWVSRILF
jgi:hypothetical protein